MKMKKYDFTIVIPDHDKGKYVKRCIGSIKAAERFDDIHDYEWGKAKICQ